MPITLSSRHPLGPRVRINVTAELITISQRANSSHCMIAEAIKKAVPNATSVAVDISTCRFSDLSKGQRYVYLTPRIAQDAIVDYDEGKTPKPFQFLLRNAHVSKAGRGRNRPKAKDNAQAQPRHAASVPIRGRLVNSHGTKHGNIPIRVGGRRPPQLHIRREFGLRAFRAASLRHWAADAQAQINPDDDGAGAE